VVNVWQIPKKSQIQIMAKLTTAEGVDFGKMKKQNWSIIAMIRSIWKRIDE
jgi:hypothetical protein